MLLWRLKKLSGVIIAPLQNLHLSPSVYESILSCWISFSVNKYSFWTWFRIFWGVKKRYEMLTHQCFTFSSQSEGNQINNKIKVVHDNFWIHVAILAKFIWYPFHQPEQKKPWHIYQNLPEPFSLENYHRKYKWHKKGLDIP